MLRKCDDESVGKREELNRKKMKRHAAISASSDPRMFVKATTMVVTTMAATPTVRSRPSATALPNSDVPSWSRDATQGLFSLL